MARVTRPGSAAGRRGAVARSTDAGASGLARVAALVSGAMLALLLLAAIAAPAALAQYPPSPAPSIGPVGGTGDPRSSGEGPGLQAEPLVVLMGVMTLGVLAAGGTLVYVRLTRDD